MAKRIVVKVGSGVLSGGGEGLSGATLRRLAGEIAKARAGGDEIIVVSSGAILAGRERLRLEKRPSVQLKQAAAAGVPTRVIGRTGGDRLRIATGGDIVIDVSIEEAERVWSTAIERYFVKKVA